MSLPTEADFALVKMGDGATPTEVFTTLCGLGNVSIGRSANTTDRFRRDCAKPGEVPYRRTRANGKQLDVTSNGAINVPDIDTFEDALGISKNYKIELYKRDGTDTGELLTTLAGPFMMSVANMNLDENGEGGAEVTLLSDGIWTWTPAA